MPIFQLPASRPKQEIYHVSMAALLCFCPHLLKPEIILPQYKHLYCISIRFKTSWYNMMMSVTKVIISKGFDDDDCVTARQHGSARSCLEGVLSHSLLPLSGGNAKYLSGGNAKYLSGLKLQIFVFKNILLYCFYLFLAPPSGS